MFLKKIFKKIHRWYFGHDPLIKIFLNRKNFLHNLDEYKKNYPNISFSPVLKGNAYGHGLEVVGKIVDKEHLPFVCVDSYYEAKNLRFSGFRTPILIIGYNDAKQILENKLKGISWSIPSLEILEGIMDAKDNISIHIKFNTGMNRLGIEPTDTDKVLGILKEGKKINVEGIYSHFADSDGEGTNFTLNQAKVWNELVQKFRKNLPNVKYFHIGATGGVKFTKDLDANVFRLGKGFYGYYADNKDVVNLRPALSLETKIINLRNVKKGEFIGYSFGYCAPKDMLVATIPMGYSEGLDKRLSNVGSVKIQNKFCKIVGKISMNMATIDVSDLEKPALGEKVEILSNNPKDDNSVSNAAKICNTNQAEILIHINPLLRRKII